MYVIYIYIHSPRNDTTTSQILQSCVCNYLAYYEISDWILTDDDSVGFLACRDLQDAPYVPQASWHRQGRRVTSGSHLLAEICGNLWPPWNAWPSSHSSPLGTLSSPRTLRARLWSLSGSPLGTLTAYGCVQAQKCSCKVQWLIIRILSCHIIFFNKIAMNSHRIHVWYIC